MIDTVTQAIDLLIEAGSTHQGLIPSILDRHNGHMLMQLHRRELFVDQHFTDLSRTVPRVAMVRSREHPAAQHG